MAGRRRAGHIPQKPRLWSYHGKHAGTGKGPQGGSQGSWSCRPAVLLRRYWTSLKGNRTSSSIIKLLLEISKLGSYARRNSVKSTLQIITVGFVWGWLQASVVFLALLFTASQYRRIIDFGSGWQVAVSSALLISFVAGIVLDDIESTVKSLLLSTFVAFMYSMIVVSVLAVPISVSPEQGYAEAVFFGFLAPIQFFVGLLLGITGSVFGRRLVPRIRGRRT